jgi:uncharacterized protein YgiM (DUF1202 family)
MRKSLSLFIIFCLLFGIAAFTANATEWEDAEDWDDDEPIVWQVIDGEEYGDDWEEDSMDDLDEDFEDDLEEHLTDGRPESKRYAKVATQKGTLNMRKAMKDNADVLNRLQKGTVVTILEEDGDWSKILFKGKTGFVKTSFLEEMSELPYTPFERGDKGNEVYTFKKEMRKLGYLKSDEVNLAFDQPMETALAKLQLMNEVAFNPTVVTAELQALMDWGLIRKAKSGYLATETDKESDLSVSIFCWDTAGVLFEEDKSVKLTIAYAAQAQGGEPPYAITVKKSVSGKGEQSADEVANPFNHIWSQTTARLYLYATVTDSGGNTVTACAPFRYVMPDRYRN